MPNLLEQAKTFLAFFIAIAMMEVTAVGLVKEIFMGPLTFMDVKVLLGLSFFATIVYLAQSPEERAHCAFLPC